jgi:hypothetical protein|tara:strand:- start:398 stop:841 length:444 start_codon:yes stop_codon:yes gene_type:complete
MIRPVDLLAEFYKHCLNVCGNIRPNGHGSPLWNGWMRCKIIPYLVDGKVQNEINTNYKELLLYTLQDYIDYINCFLKVKDHEKTIDNTEKLLSILYNMDNGDIINMIENNNNKFPCLNDCDNQDILDDTYNTIELSFIYDEQEFETV